MPDDHSIFVVDDHGAVHPSIVEMLSDGGHHCATFRSPENFLTSYQPDSHGCLIVGAVDDRAAILNLQRKVNERRWPLGTIFVIPSEDAQTAVAAMKGGASEVLLTPVADDVLLDAVEIVLTQSRERQKAVRRQERMTARVAGLSPREREVMVHLVAGYQTKEIARKLDIAPRTVKAHRANIRDKLKANTTAKVIRIGLELGMRNVPIVLAGAVN